MLALEVPMSSVEAAAALFGGDDSASDPFAALDSGTDKAAQPMSASEGPSSLFPESVSVSDPFSNLSNEQPAIVEQTASSDVSNTPSTGSYFPPSAGNYEPVNGGTAQNYYAQGTKGSGSYQAYVPAVKQQPSHGSSHYTGMTNSTSCKFECTMY